MIFVNFLIFFLNLSLRFFKSLHLNLILVANLSKIFYLTLLRREWQAHLISDHLKTRGLGPKENWAGKIYSKQNKSHALSFQNFFPTVRNVAQDIPDERPKANFPPPIFMRSQRHPKAKAHLYGKRLLWSLNVSTRETDLRELINWLKNVRQKQRLRQQIASLLLT